MLPSPRAPRRGAARGAAGAGRALRRAARAVAAFAATGAAMAGASRPPARAGDGRRHPVLTEPLVDVDARFARVVIGLHALEEIGLQQLLDLIVVHCARWARPRKKRANAPDRETEGRETA